MSDKRVASAAHQIQTEIDEETPYGIQIRSSQMKLISAIIRPPKLEAVLAALEDVAIERLTICDGQAYDNPRGECDSSGAEDLLLRIVNLEIVVNDDFVERAIEAICTAAKTRSDEPTGDGKLFVFSVEEVITIDDQSRGPQAV